MVVHEDGRTYPHDADNEARVYEDVDGRLWVTHEDLLKCGYRDINDFDVVYLNGRFFELQGYIHKAESWWIEEVETEETPEQAQEVYSGEPT